MPVPNFDFLEHQIDGFPAGSYSDRTHTTFTLRQNYISWSIRCCKRFAIEPFTPGVYLNLITGEDYWVRESDKYPGDSYYGFTSRLRTYLYVGQRFTYYCYENSYCLLYWEPFLVYLSLPYKDIQLILHDEWMF